VTGPRIGAIAALAVVASLTAACGGDRDIIDRSERSARTIETCRDHGGVAAFDDDSVICADQTFDDERGRSAVAACREHDGVAAFDDDIVICRDQTSHEAAGG
jgi:hypothetical protein